MEEDDWKKPYSGKLNVRFDEGELEIGHSYYASSLLYPIGFLNAGYMFRICPIVTFLIFITLLHGSVQIVGSPFELTQRTTDEPATTRTPITVKLEISKAPKLNEDVLVKCIVTSILDAPKTVIKIELPEAAIKLSGDLNWEGDLIQGVPVELSIKVRFIEEGNWTIRATAIHMVDEQNSWGDVDSIYLNVTKESGEFGFSDSYQRGKAKTRRIP